MASINRIKAEAAAAQHERDTMAEQLRAALEHTRKMEVACQEWIAEMQREARLSMTQLTEGTIRYERLSRGCSVPHV